MSKSIVLELTDDHADTFTIEQNSRADGYSVIVTVADPSMGEQRRSAFSETDDIRKIAKYLVRAADRIDKANGKTRPKKRRRKDMAEEIAQQAATIETLRNTRETLNKEAIDLNKQLCDVNEGRDDCFRQAEEFEDWHLKSHAECVALRSERDELLVHMKRQTATITEQKNRLGGLKAVKDQFRAERDELLGLIRERFTVEGDGLRIKSGDINDGVWSDDFMERWAKAVHGVLRKHEQTEKAEQPIDTSVPSWACVGTVVDQCDELDTMRGDLAAMTELMEKWRFACQWTVRRACTLNRGICQPTCPMYRKGNGHVSLCNHDITGLPLGHIPREQLSGEKIPLPNLDYSAI